MHVCDLDYRENDRGEKDYCERGPEDRGEHYQAEGDAAAAARTGYGAL
jgi:hypothetical protein